MGHKLFSLYNLFPAEETLLASLYSIAIFRKLQVFVPPVPKFLSRTRQDIYLEPCHSLYFSLVKRKLYSAPSSQILYYGTDSHEGTSKITTILTTSNRESTVIYPTYYHYMPRLVPPCTQLQQPQLVTHYIEWLLCLIIGEQ